MTDTIKHKYIKYFYLSDFSVSLALGMIPLMTVLSYFISSLSTSTFSYAVMLALYNIFTSLPKVYVAKHLSNRANTFDSILKFKVAQITIWFLISIVFFFFPDSTNKVILFCSLYLIYAFTKGSIEVLNIDVYSKVLPSNKLGKFFGFKHSLNSLGEFIGAMTLVSLFNFLEIEINYGIIFMLVFLLDIISFSLLCILRGVVHLSDTEDETLNKKSPLLAPDEVQINKKGLRVLRKTYIEISATVSNDPVFKSFLVANVISIVGASVASFFIPYATDTLKLNMDSISLANAIWLVSKVVSAVFWGILVDIVGAKYTMIGSRLALLASYFIAIKLKNVQMFYLMLILHGISSSALVVMAQNIFIEISKKDSALYAAINSVICMPFFVLMPIMASFLSDTFGYVVSFEVSSIPLILSLILMNKVKLKNKRVS